MKIAGVYYIKNIINNKYYIGSSIDINRRLTEHKRRLKLQNHPSKILQNSYNKYGVENFEFKILEKAEDVVDIYLTIRILEQKYFDNINYNIDFNCVKKVILDTESFIKYRSESRQVRKVSDITKNKISSTLKQLGISEERQDYMQKRYFEEKQKSPDKFKISQKNIDITIERKQKTFYFLFNNTIIKVINLKKFCRENQLSHSMMDKIHKGTRINHKGYTKYD